MKNNLKAQLIISIVLCVIGCGLLIAGFIIPPAGIIDNSVLIAFGEILTFIGSVSGIDYNYRIKIFNKNSDEDNI